MNITVIGAGVVGATYAWQLAEAGHDIQVVARSRRRAALERGLEISCVDQRWRKTLRASTFRPATIPALNLDTPPDLVLVCVQRQHLRALLPTLAALPEPSTILFMHQQWNDSTAFAPELMPKRCLLGYPAVGGGHDRAGIFCWLMPEAMQIGALDGRHSPRIGPVAMALRSASLRIDLRTPMQPLLAARAGVRVALAGGALKAGSIYNLARCPRILAEVVLAVQESLNIYAVYDPTVWRLPFTQAYTYPLEQTVRLLQRTLKRPTVRCALGGCLMHTWNELRDLAAEICATGRHHGVASRSLNELCNCLNLLPAVDRFVQGQPENNSIPRPLCAQECPRSCLDSTALNLETSNLDPCD
ncbi:MAG: hypothetical protein MI924_35345 [Chloroflexales bacterium]|nr:hypothetical protein [Chloroflexales bacterium]